MKDLEYFLVKEDDYLSKYGNEPNLIFNDFGELEPSDFDIPDSFLRQRFFHNINYNDFPYKNDLENYNLSPIEIIILRLFIGDKSYLFRDDFYSEIPEVVREMQIVLDIVISKAPMYDGNVLYRVLNEYDRVDLSIGEVFVPCFSLTCSKDDWKTKADKYIIHTKVDNTKAHSVYLFHNHGNECQVNFIKGTSFRVIDIRFINECRNIVLEEI